MSLGNHDISCVVSFKKVRAIYLKIKPDGLLYVTAPTKYKDKIHDVLITKSKWILNHFDLIGKQKKLITNDTVYFLGNLCSLEIQRIETGRQCVKIKTSTFTLHIKDPEKKNIWLDHFLKIHTTHYIQDMLPKIIQKTGLIPSHVQIRKMKKWGSCTKNGALLFNSYLICLPPSLIDYIMYHELTHLLHFDHSVRFKNALANFLPEVKKLEKELKMYVR